MPSLQNKTFIHCISRVECMNRVSTTNFQNRKHIGGYRDVQKTFLLKFNQEHDGKLKHMQITLENKSVVQNMKYNKNCDRVCADVRAPFASAIIYLIYLLLKTKIKKINVKIYVRFCIMFKF